MKLKKPLSWQERTNCDGELYDTVKSISDELATAFIVSQVEVLKGNEGIVKGEVLKNISMTVVKADGEKCERCWMHSETVGKNSEHKTLCERCAKVIESM